MKLLLVIAGLMVASCSARSHLNAQWEEYKLKYSKTYENAETEAMRQQIWLETLKRIETHNARYQAGQVSYYLGLNHMSDMTHAEKVALRGHRGADKKVTPLQGVNLAFSDLPKSVDWRKKGAVNKVKDQKQCGSCWAFSAVASLEGQYFRKNGTLKSFSEQQLVDCVTDANGCHGGLMDLAFTYLKSNGLEGERDYPYKAVDLHCAYDETKIELFRVTDFIDIPSGDEQALQKAVAEVGPVSVAIDASQPDFNDYAGGIYDSSTCGNEPENLDHGVAVVGYGTTDESKDYFIVRNSWSEHWGEEGYIRMSRNKDNQCGIATMASYPVVV